MTVEGIVETAVKSIAQGLLRRRLVFAWLASAIGGGCEQAPPPEFTTSLQVAELSTELQTSLREELERECGTFAEPAVVGRAVTDGLKDGQVVYQKYCVQCHGVSGDGNGPAAAYLYPRPRDYRKGLFKFTSTRYGSRPLKSDLERTIRFGARGTSMPGFSLLPDRDIDAVIEYVLMLTKRGEYEEGLVNLAQSEEALEPAIIASDVKPLVLDRWSQAELDQVTPLSPQPQFTQQHVAAGRQAFLTIGCAKCHGEDGRGQMPDNIGKDAWGRTTRAADLTSGMLHGGPRPIDIYRRIFSGVNGTPMPGFASALQSQPDTIWNLVAYVLHVSNRRRLDDAPPPGPIKPYVPIEERDTDTHRTASGADEAVAAGN